VKSKISENIHKFGRNHHLSSFLLRKVSVTHTEKQCKCGTATM